MSEFLVWFLGSGPLLGLLYVGWWLSMKMVSDIKSDRALEAELALMEDKRLAQKYELPWPE